MKKSELKQLIKEQVKMVLSEARTYELIAKKIEGKITTNMNERQVIDLIAKELTSMNYTDKQIRYMISYDEDFITDVFSQFSKAILSKIKK